MDSKLQILVMSYMYPPVGEVGSLRVSRFCRYLPEFGIQPIVITVRERVSIHYDDSLPMPPGLRVERTDVLPSPLDLYRGWKRWRVAPGNLDDKPAAVQVRQSPGLFRRHALALLQTPDRHWNWYVPAVRAAKKILKGERVAAIFSSGPPWVSHLVARHLKRNYRLPWLADFRDPWGYDPFREDFPRWRHWVNRRLEANCMRWANRVLCNTERLRQFFIQIYPDERLEKFVLLTNGFDDPIVPRSSAVPMRATRLFLHLGSLYAQRRIDTFCEAIGNLVRQGRLDPRSFNIRFLGEADPSLVSAASQRVPDLMRDNVIQFQPKTSWQEAQHVLWGADLLLLFQGSWKLEVPAKFFEYLLTGKPIFAVAKEGALTDVLKSTGSGIWADPDDPTDIANKFLLALEQKPRSSTEVWEHWFDKFHYRALTERLAQCIREVAIGTRRGEEGRCDFL